jgi:hypothetical protein
MSFKDFTYYIDPDTKRIVLYLKDKLLKNDFFYVEEVENYITEYIRDYKINELINPSR